MKASLRSTLFVMGAISVCGLGVLSSASASSALTSTPDAVALGGKDGGGHIELADFVTGGKDGGGHIELGNKDGGGHIELADFVTGGKDGGGHIELLAQADKGGRDGGAVATQKTDGGK